MEICFYLHQAVMMNCIMKSLECILFSTIYMYYVRITTMIYKFYILQNWVLSIKYEFKIIASRNSTGANEHKYSATKLANSLINIRLEVMIIFNFIKLM